jgi:glutathione S-transferase
MKLFTFDAAPNPRRVNLFLAYKGIDIPKVQINLREAEQLGEAYKAINPRCIVPALQLDDGTVLCDGIGICWYLESLYPQRPLLGTNALQQAQVLSWEHMSFADGFVPAADVLRNRSGAFKDRALPGPEAVPQIPELEARGRQRLARFWRYLDGHLQGREFLVGNSLTFADINALVITDFAGWSKQYVPEDCARTHAWLARVRALLPA